MAARSAVRLVDVAARAGVTASTASRALSRPEIVRPETRTRVEAAVRELGYVPNRIARAVVTGRTGTIVFVVPDLTNNLFARIARAVQTEARVRGFDTMIVDSQMSVDREAELIDRSRRFAEGLIVCMPQGAYRADAGHPPVVAVNRRMKGSHAVLVDQANTVEQQVAHLTGLGHRRMLYIDGPDRYWATHERRRHVERLRKRHSIDVVSGVPFTFAGGRAVAERLDPSITAVLTFTDIQAAGIIARSTELGRRVPDDLSVIGANDMPIASFCSPPITTMRTPTEALGRAAVSLLLDTESAAHGTAIIETMATQLVVRESTGPASDRRGRVP